MNPINFDSGEKELALSPPLGWSEMLPASSRFDSSKRFDCSPSVGNAIQIKCLPFKSKLKWNDTGRCRSLFRLFRFVRTGDAGLLGRTRLGALETRIGFDGQDPAGRLRLHLSRRHLTDDFGSLELSDAHLLAGRRAFAELHRLGAADDGHRRSAPDGRRRRRNRDGFRW